MTRLEFIPNDIANHLLTNLSILRQPNTIQIYMLRQTHDYSIFRTEETRELNVAVLPKSVKDMTPTTRVAMLASKQKAPESRHFNTIVRGIARDNKLPIGSAETCELKDNLCRSCPRCVLFGAVSTESGQSSRWNIKHRIEYSTAYSLEQWEEISEITTFNAVSTATQSTGQALGYTENIVPLANFPSIVTLSSATQEELVTYLKTLMSCKSYGAETRTKGDMVNVIVGVSAGYEELLTPLEYNLELCAYEGYKKDPVKATFDILTKYKEMAAFKDKAVVLPPDEFKKFINAAREFSPSKDFMQKLYSDATGFANEASQMAKNEAGKKEK